MRWAHTCTCSFHMPNVLPHPWICDCTHTHTHTPLILLKCCPSLLVIILFPLPLLRRVDASGLIRYRKRTMNLMKMQMMRMKRRNNLRRWNQRQDHNYWHLLLRTPVCTERERERERDSTNNTCTLTQCTIVSLHYAMLWMPNVYLLAWFVHTHTSR